MIKGAEAEAMLYIRTDKCEEYRGSSGLREEGYLKSVAGAGQEEYAFSSVSFRECQLKHDCFLRIHA